MYRQGCQASGILYGCHASGCPTKPQAHSSAETAKSLIKSPTFPLISSTQTTPSPFPNEQHQMSSRHPVHPGLKRSRLPKLQAARSSTPTMIKPQHKISHLVPVPSKGTISLLKQFGGRKEGEAQALGSYGQVSVPLVPKRNALLESSMCQRATCKILMVVKASALLSESACWISDHSRLLLFPRESHIPLSSHQEWAAASLAPGSGGKRLRKKTFPRHNEGTCTLQQTLHLRPLLFPSPSPPFSLLFYLYGRFSPPQA